MKKTVFITVAAAIFCFFASVVDIYAGTVGPRQGREISPYPEYSGVFKRSSIKYSKPNFGGKKHYWVRYWNAGGHYEENGKVVWDGVAYDGHLLYNPKVVFDKKVNENRFYFTDENFKDQKDPMNRPAERFFYGNQVVDDPRLTNWWMSFVEDEVKYLFQAIENGAMTKKHSEITGAILKNIIESGLIKRVDIKNMRPKQIKDAINDYTNIALTYNLDQTYAVMRMRGGVKMDQNVFFNLREGDVIIDYYWSRFGPFPLVSYEAHIVKVSGVRVDGKKEPKKTITVRFWNRKKTEEIKWEEISDYTNFMVIEAH